MYFWVIVCFKIIENILSPLFNSYTQSWIAAAYIVQKHDSNKYFRISTWDFKHFLEIDLIRMYVLYTPNKIQFYQNRL